MKRNFFFLAALAVCLAVIFPMGAEAQNIPVESRPRLLSREYEYCDSGTPTMPTNKLCWHYFADEIQIVLENSPQNPRIQRADELPSVRFAINSGKVESYEFFSEKFIRERNFSPEMAQKIENSDLSNIIQLRLKNVGGDEDFMELFNTISKDKNIKEVHKLSETQALGHTNDPLSTRQWYFDRVKFPEAQAIAGYGSPEIHVMSPDSGYDVTHPDLPRPYGFFNHLTNIKEIPVDRLGHGTATAGMIVQIPNNGIGGIGTAPGVSLWVRKVLSDGGIGEWSSFAAAVLDQTAECVRLRRENPNVRCIFTISMGGLGPIPVVDVVLDIALKEGIVVVAAAGNVPVDLAKVPLYPAAKRGVIAVTASNEKDELADWSPFGSELLTTMAPSTDILVPVPKDSNYIKYNDPSGYIYATGTSFGAPQVAGAIALLWTQHRDLSPEQVRFITLGGADVIPSAQPFIASGGRINAQTMVNVPFGEIPLPPKTFEVGNASHISLKTRQSFSDGVVGYIHYISNQPFDEDSLNRKDVRQIFTFDPSLRGNIGKVTEKTIGDLQENTTWYLGLKPVHITGSLPELSNTIEVATKKSEVHIARTFTADNGECENGQWYVEAHNSVLTPVWHFSDVLRSISENKCLWRFGRKGELGYNLGAAHAMVMSETFDLRKLNGASLRYEFFQSMSTILPGIDEFQFWALPFADDLQDNRDTAILLKNYKNEPNSKRFETKEELIDLTGVAGTRFRLGFRVYLRSGGRYGGDGWFFGNVRLMIDQREYLY